MTRNRPTLDAWTLDLPAWIVPVCIALTWIAPAAFAQPPQVEPSPELERLHFQLGDWHSTTETLNRQGEVVATRRGRAEIKLEHRGLMIHALHYPEDGDEPAWRIWQYHDRYDGQLHDVSFDAVGHFEHRVEVTGKGDLSFAFPTFQAFQDGVPRNWRKTYSEITADAFQVLWDFTEDATTWTPIFRTTYERNPERDRELDAGRAPSWMAVELRAPLDSSHAADHLTPSGLHSSAAKITKLWTGRKSNRRSIR